MLEELKVHLHSAGADLVGFADLGALAPDKRDGLPCAISIAVALTPAIVLGIGHGPTTKYWDEYRRVNEQLAVLAARTAESLNRQAYQAKALLTTLDHLDPVTDSQVSYEPGTLSTKLPHKTAATLAGLGWIGKCALLVTHHFGSAVRLTTVLTNAPLVVDKPIQRSQCGTCTACVDACPGHAASGRSWTVGAERQSFFDAYACRKTADEQAARVGVGDTICGICINVCPWTQRYIRRTT